MASMWGVYRVESRPTGEDGLGHIVPLISKVDLWPPFFPQKGLLRNTLVSYRRKIPTAISIPFRNYMGPNLNDDQLICVADDGARRTQKKGEEPCQSAHLQQ